MIVVHTRSAVTEALAPHRAAGRRIALVPTMGGLHEGHLSLIDAARERADVVVLSLFVNPLQFGPGEDFDRYPRDLERDAALAGERGTDLLFAPSSAEMYPHGATGVYVTAPDLASHLCGAFRPGHFDGVLTVVAKLFHIAAPDVAVFGRKDFQQCVLIRRMAEDLDFGIEIVAAPIVRESDGLAMSSRNVYLSAAERADALRLSRGLRSAVDAFRAGQRDPAALVARVRDELHEGTVRAEYIELVDARTLEPVEHASPGDVLALAGWVGKTRLIDNVELKDR